MHHYRKKVINTLIVLLFIFLFIFAVSVINLRNDYSLINFGMSYEVQNLILAFLSMLSIIKIVFELVTI